jgi:hypothetical protein
LFLSIVLSSSSLVSAAAIDDLGWLVGRWMGTEGATVTVETWQRPMGGMMLGTNQTVRGETTVAFEFMRIALTDEGLAFLAAPGGGEETRFMAVQSEDGLLVFEAPDHDFPQRIRYRRTGDLLSVRIETLDGERGREWTWRRTR